MAARAFMLVFGLFQVALGLYMVASPAGWYASTPGVSMTGPMNHHFITDIGLAFLASGVGLALGFRAGATAAAFALAGATWPVLHALFHIWGWSRHGFPRDPAAALTEAVGVVLLSGASFALAIWRARKEGVI